MNKPRYVILGAGISGLSLGWFLKKKHGNDIELTILEASDRPGSWIRKELKDGYLFEQGARSFRTGGTGTAHLHLIESLGLQDEVIFAHQDAFKRYVFVDGKLRMLPLGLLSCLYSRFTPEFTKALWKDWRAPKGDGADESIYSFISRRFGWQIAELIVDPMVSGIFAGDIKQLSIKSCFPWIYDLEQKYRCVLKGAIAERNLKDHEKWSPFVENSLPKKVFTLKNGVQTLTEKLVEKLKENLHFNCAATKLSFKDGFSIVESKNGKAFVADKLFVAIPPPVFGDLVQVDNPVLAQNLQEIRSASLGIVNVGYKSPVLRYKGFGCLMLSREKHNILGAVWDSCAFPQQNTHPDQTRLTVLMGGAHFADFESQTDNQLIELALQKLSQLFNITQEPDCLLLKRAHKAIPQYTVGHEKRLRIIEGEIEKIPAEIELLGSGFYGVSVNDCIGRAKVLST